MADYRYQAFLLHVREGCPWCVRAKSLLEQCRATYATTTDPCGEWPTVPAIYGITSSGQKELIGGFTELAELDPAAISPGNSPESQF